jgi:hypothetical protein
MSRRLGRPPLDDHAPTVPVTVRMPATRYEELCRLAVRDRRSVGDVIRASLKIHCRRSDGSEPDDER